MLESLQTTARTRANISATVGSPPRSTRNTNVLTKNPTKSSKTGSERPAIGKPTAHIRGATELAQQHRQRRLHHHETVALYCRANPQSTPAPQQATHRHRGTAIISHHRIRPIRGQHHPLSHPRQRLLPIRQLRTDHTARIIKIPELRPLPNV